MKIAIPQIDILPKVAVRTAEDLPIKERVRMVVKTCLLGTLAWDYVDTVLNMAAQMRIQQTKEVSRLIRQIKREYDQYLSPTLHDSDIEHTKRLSELFEDINTKTFSRLCQGLKAEIGRIADLDSQNVYLVQAVQMVMTVIDTMKLYDKDCGEWMEANGVPNHTVIPSHFMRVATLIPQYAGDCYDPKSEARWLTAKILYKDIRNMELYDENGQV